MLSFRAKVAVTAATVAAGLGTWVGVTCGCPVPFFPDPAQTANVWVNPTGSDAGANCSRQASAAVAPSDLTTVCRTWGKAYSLASLGDEVGVTPGTYGGETISQTLNKSGTPGTCNAATDFQGGSPTYTGCVDFVIADGTDVPSIGLTSCVSYWRILVESGGHLHMDVQIGKGDNGCGTSAMHDIVFDGDIDIDQPIFDGTYNMTLRNGVSIGPAVNQAGIIQCGNNAGYCPHDILFDGVTWHDFTRTSSTHMECLHVLQQGFNLTIRRNVFKNCTVYDVSIQPSKLNGANGVWNNVLVENSTFDLPCSHPNVGDNASSCPGLGGLNGGSLIFILTNGDTLTNATVRFNSMYGGFKLQDDNSNGTFTNTRAYGNNITGNCTSSAASAGHNWTQDYNVWSGTGGAGTICSGDSTSLYSTSNGFVDAANYDLHIGTSAAAKNLVPAAISGGAPTVDVDGDSRPISTNFDAGADERS